MPLFGKVAGLITGPLFAVPLAAADGFSLLTVVVSLLGGGAGVSLVNAWHRRRTGEGPSSAAESLARAAESLGEAGERLIEPLTRQNQALAKQNAECLDRVVEAERRYNEKAEQTGALTMKLADAAADNVRAQTQAQTDRHADRSELAALAAQLAHKDLVIDELGEEIRALKVQLGDQGQNRRSSERRQT